MMDSKKREINSISTESQNNLTNDQKIVLDYAQVPVDLKVNIQDAQTISKEARQMNESFEITKNIYQNVLAPQLEKNEKLKRKQKQILMNNIFRILKLQFLFTYVFVFILMIGILTSEFLGISEHVVINLINFIKFYITSIVVELLSILFFIVKNVFDKSIVDLIRNFDKIIKKHNKKC